MANKLVNYLKKRYGTKNASAQRRGYSVFQVLIACVLSQRTREENTDKAASRLFSVARTPCDILKLSDKQLASLIKPCGFYNQKTRTIKKLCKVLVDDYKGKVPKSKEEMMKLPGVGPKTASVTLCYGFNEPCIPVDVHVEVVSKRLGLAPKKAKPVEVQKILEDLIPKKDQEIVNRGLVHFGREICTTRNPKCKKCSFVGVCIDKEK